MADEITTIDPVLRDAHKHSDKAGKELLYQTDKLRASAEAYAPQSHKDEHEKKDEQPAGGYDSTPIHSASPGFTMKITFHRAQNLPFADFSSLSSDPYLMANVKTDLPKRHKQDPDLIFRTPTIRRDVNPRWDSVWTIAHIPPTGFTMKIRVYDEDAADSDDRLGNVHLHVDGIHEEWPSIKERSYGIKKRMASKRAYLFRGCAALILRNVSMNAQLIVSVECLGRSKGEGGRAYTTGLLPWTRHYSPLIGRLTGTKDSGQAEDGKTKPAKYNFQAIQMQLRGPVPQELYHRYVEFKPFVAGMFNSKSLRGWILNRALHHQHNRIYNFDRSTLYGYFSKPSVDMTKKFLDFVDYDHGGRIFTYVLTLDSFWRFTETGKEFGIDLLSKHTMHSDVSIYIAFSGEFFVRRLKKPWRRKEKPPGSSGITGQDDHDDGADPQSNALLPEAESDSEDESRSDHHRANSATDPSHYELIIDNDSGTYRPSAKTLPALRKFMGRSLPGLRVVTLDCLADAENLDRMKSEQTEKRNKSKGMQYLQRDSASSSISSSDEEDLDDLARRNQSHQEKRQKQGKLNKAKQGFKTTATRVKTMIATISSDGHGAEEGDLNEKNGEGCGGMGGNVGEDGPLKMRERKKELKAEKELHVHPGTPDGEVDDDSTRDLKETGGGSAAIYIEKDVELSNGKDTQEVYDQKVMPNGRAD